MTTASDRAYQKAYRETHQEHRKAYGRAYYRAHQEALKANTRAYYEAHLEECKAYHLAYRKAHRQELSIKNRAYNKAHPEKKKARKHKRRALEQGVMHQPYKVGDIVDRDRGVCCLCGKRVAKADRSIDHILPLSMGGADAPHNVQLAHQRCNKAKSNSARFPANLRLALD